MAQKKALSIDDQAREFWQAFQLNFPAAKCVVLSDHASRKPPFKFLKQFMVIASTCPLNIKLYVSLKDYEDDIYRKNEYTLYQWDQRLGIQFKPLQRK